MVYKRLDGSPVMKEWCDVSDDGQTDKFYWYKTTAKKLKAFLTGEISSREHILYCEGGFVVFTEDGSANKTENVEDIPNSYLPKPSARVSASDVMDLDAISKAFDLQI